MSLQIQGVLHVRPGKKDGRLFYDVEGLNVIPAENSNPPTTGGYYRVICEHRYSPKKQANYLFAAAFIPVAQVA